MELRQLHYFLTICEEKSITKAAERLFITQPSLSKQMQNLEAELNCQLFIRGARTISLTEKGKILALRAAELIELEEKTNKELQTREDNIEGEITDYALTPLSVGSDALAAETRLSMTVNVRFTNNTNHDEDFETRFSANRTFQNTQTLNDVQEQLVGEMIEEIVDQIFNATVANW